MFKQLLFLIVLSLIVLLTIGYCQAGLHYLYWAHHWIVKGLSQIFAGGEAGYLIKNIISLLVIPCVIGGVLAAIYWLVKRGHMPYTYHIIWVVWLLLMVTVVLKH